MLLDIWEQWHKMEHKFVSSHRIFSRGFSKKSKKNPILQSFFEKKLLKNYYNLVKQYQTTWNGSSWPKECFDWEKLSYFSKKIQLFSFAHILGLKLNLVSCRHLDISETLLWKNRESVSSHIIVSMEFSKKSKKNPIFGYFFRNFFWKTIRTLRNSIELLETAHYNPNNILVEKV